MVVVHVVAKHTIIGKSCWTLIVIGGQDKDIVEREALMALPIDDLLGELAALGFDTSPDIGDGAEWNTFVCHTGCQRGQVTPAKHLLHLGQLSRWWQGFK